MTLAKNAEACCYCGGSGAVKVAKENLRTGERTVERQTCSACWGSGKAS